MMQFFSQTGNWVEGVKRGSGRWITDNYIFIGYFRDDLPVGRGKFSFDSGCEQYGYYKMANLVEQVDNRKELVGQEARWTCTGLISVQNESELLNDTDL